jgi:Fe-S-cluster containining protein
MPDDHGGVPPGSVGTAPHDAPVPREDLERALRRATLAIEGVRDDVMQLAAQVVALGNELARRDAAIEAAVDAETPKIADQIRVADERATTHRVLIGESEDKYRTATTGPNCLELLPICEGRCCKLHFALSSQDLDEAVIRWDYGRPYLIKQRASDGYCVHNDPTQRGCTVYTHRPRPCREYDCRDDQRIWKDFEARIPAVESPYARKDGEAPTELDLVERVRARQIAFAMEHFSLTTRESERRRLEQADEPTKP